MYIYQKNYNNLLEQGFKKQRFQCLLMNVSTYFATSWCNKSTQLLIADMMETGSTLSRKYSKPVSLSDRLEPYTYRRLHFWIPPDKMW